MHKFTTVSLNMHFPPYLYLTHFAEKYSHGSQDRIWTGVVAKQADDYVFVLFNRHKQQCELFRSN